MNPDSLRHEIEARTVFEEKVSTAIEIPFSDSAKRVLESAAVESDRLLHTYIGTEHLLLGVLREERSIAGEFLNGHGLRLDEVRQEIVGLLNKKASHNPE